MYPSIRPDNIMSKSVAIQKHNRSLVQVYLLLLMSVISLVACGGSGSESPADSAGEQANSSGGENDLTELGTLDENVSTGEVGGVVPGDSASGDLDGEAERIGLVVDSSQRCAVMFEPLEIVITAQLAEGEEPEVADSMSNITGLVTFEQSLGSSLELVSRNDAAAIFQMNEQDIVGLTASTGGGSVTAFIAGYDASAPDSFIMRKPVTNGCLYAFKAEDVCATGLSRAGGFSVSRNGVSMSALGCELQNPDNLPVIELPSIGL